MKNLKKVLALVLAFACAFTMFAGAVTYTDQAEITQAEAVDMLTALGVIDGYPDGSFQPDANITRAEAAKMIYTIWNGGNTNASAFEGTSIFTDVYRGYWAEGYINFCYANGIIDGVGNLQFAPERNVTGTELAKMLLVCMGYQVEHSGLSGANYAQRTNALATQNGLYVDVTAPVASAMPRQFAAQIMYNALKADTVVWSSDRNAYERVSTVIYQMVADSNGNYALVPISDYETLGKKCMGLETREVMLTSVKQESGRETYSLNDGAFTRVTSDYSDLIGQRVNVLIRDGETNQVYGVYAHEDSSVIATGVVGQLESANETNKIKLNGTTYDLDATTSAYNVYNTNSDTASMRLADLDDMANKSQAAWNIKLIDIDGDGDANHAVVQKVDIKKVTYVNSDGIRVDGINNGNSIDFDENEVYADAARDDWAVVVDKDHTSSGNYVVTKAEVLSGRVGSVHTDNTTNNVTELRVDGTWYKNASSTLDTAMGSNVDLVVYGGVYFNVEGSASALDVAVVTGVGDWNNMDGVLTVRLMFRDGTEEVVNVEAVDPANEDDVLDRNTYDDVSLLDKMFAYDTNDDKYSLYSIKAGNIMVGALDNQSDTRHDAVLPASGWSYDDERAVIVNGSRSYDIAEGAMVVIKNNNDDYVYMTGADLLERNSITFDGSVQGYLAMDEDGQIVALFGSTTRTISIGATNYGYIVDTYQAENADQDVKLYISVITADGLQENVETDEKSAGSNYGIGTIISYTMDGDVMVIDKATDINTDAIRSYSDRSVRFYDRTADQTGATYTITSDTVIISIDGSTINGNDDDASFAGNYLTEANAYNQRNAAYILDGNNIEVIFVEVGYQRPFAYR
nr:S-layer homology domain-containing protein [uncultured Agathobaculum sp.]